jgi:hypothetical protein
LITSFTPIMQAEKDKPLYTNAGNVQADAQNSLIGVVKKVAEGDMPSNRELTGSIDRATGYLETQKRQDPALDSQGRATVSHVQAVLQDVKDILEDKNQDEKLQSILKNTATTSKEVYRDPAIQQAKEDIKAKAADRSSFTGAVQPSLAEARHALRDLLKLLITSPEFRAMLIEGQLWLQDTVFSNLKLASTGQPAVAQHEHQHQHPSFGHATFVPSSGSYSIPIQEVSEVPAYTPSPTYIPPATTIPAPQVTMPPATIQPYAASSSLHPSGSGPSPINTSPVNADNLDAWIKALSLGEDRSRKAFDKFASLLRRLGGTPQYRAAVDNIYTVVDVLTEQVRSMKADSGDVHKSALAAVKQNESVRTLLNDAQEMLERFMGGRSFDPFLDYLRLWVDQVRHDTGLRQFFTDARAYIKDVLTDPRLLDDPAVYRRGIELIDLARGYAYKYRDHQYTRMCLDEFKAIVECIRNDPHLSRLADDTKLLAHDVVSTTPEGKMHINTHVISQMRHLLVPLLTEELKYIPIGTIEGTSPDYDYRLQNLVLSGYQVMPEHIFLKFRNGIDFNLKDLAIDKSHHEVKLTVKNMKLHIRDVKFWFKKKKRPVRLEDEGLADIDIKGRGAKLTLFLTVGPSAGKNAIFHVERCKLDIDRLKLRMRDTKHDFLYNTMTTLFGGIIKLKVERRVEQKVMEFARKLETALSDLVVRLQNARNKNQSSETGIKDTILSAMKSSFTSTVTGGQPLTSTSGARPQSIA